MTFSMICEHLKKQGYENPHVAKRLSRNQSSFLQKLTPQEVKVMLASEAWATSEWAKFPIHKDASFFRLRKSEDLHHAPRDLWKDFNQWICSLSPNQEVSPKDAQKSLNVDYRLHSLFLRASERGLLEKLPGRGRYQRAQHVPVPVAVPDTAPVANRAHLDQATRVAQHFLGLPSQFMQGANDPALLATSGPYAAPSTDTESQYTRAQQSAAYQAHMFDYVAIDTSTQDQLQRMGFQLVATPGQGLNCLIYSLLESVTGLDGNQLHSKAAALRHELENQFPVVPGFLQSDDAIALHLLTLIQRDFGVNVGIVTVQPSINGPAVVTHTNPTAPYQMALYNPNGHFQPIMSHRSA